MQLQRLIDCVDAADAGYYQAKLSPTHLWLSSHILGANRALGGQAQNFGAAVFWPIIPSEAGMCRTKLTAKHRDFPRLTSLSILNPFHPTGPFLDPK